MLISIGLVLKDKWLRYLGLLLVFIVISKLGSMIIVMPNTTYRVLVFILVGLLLITGSFVYQKLSIREE